MGCTESVPVANEFQEIHKVDHPSLGCNHGASPSKSTPTQLVVREKLFSWSGDSFSIRTRDGLPFGNDLQIKGKAFSFRDQMVLQNGSTGEPVAVCLRKFEVFGETFKIYSTRPLFPGQRPSERKYDQYTLYTFAKVERVPFSTTQEVTLDWETSPSFTIHRAGIWPKKRVVRWHGRTAALMEGGTWEGNWNSYLLTVNPGIDPCLIVCLAAICDEMDESDR